MAILRREMVVICIRCGNPLLPYASRDDEGAWVGQRCVMCGHRTDPVIIMFHRSLPTPPEPHREHALPVYRPKKHGVVSRRAG